MVFFSGAMVDFTGGSTVGAYDSIGEEIEDLVVPYQLALKSGVWKYIMQMSCVGKSAVLFGVVKV